MNLCLRALAVFAMLVQINRVLADDIPVSVSPPGGLAASAVPQFILITLDDSTTQDMYNGVNQISGHTNPDGSPAAFTFFVSLDSPDFYLTHRLHAAGNEIAVHTVTHTTGSETSLENWVREIACCRQALIRYSQIPAEDLRGFRSPYLAYNGDTFNVLHALGFEYDSSVPETIPGQHSPSYTSLIWPYTLHDGLKQNAWTGTPPSVPLPDLMEIPMWTLEDGDGFHNMDPATPSKEHLVTMLKANFNTRYENNRVPLALWLHKGWFDNPANIEGLNEFLTWARTRDDVWIVPVGKLVTWIKNPIPVTDPALEAMLHVATYEPIPEEEALSNAFGNSFRTVGVYAHSAISPQNLFWELQEVETTLQARIVITSDWGSGFQGDVVLSYPGETAISDWTLTLDTSTVNITSFWGTSRLVPGGSTAQVDGKGVWGSTIQSGTSERVIASFVANGDASGLQVNGITVKEVKPVPADLRIGTDPISGAPVFHWQACAPMYQFQGRTSLTEGAWQNIQLLYGKQEVTAPPDTPYRLFRVQSIH